MIYLARITDRVPVLPPFIPSHVSGEAGFLPFSDVFNTTRLGQSLGKAVVEWSDVKKEGSETMDEIGCWNVWEASQYDEHYPRGSGMTSHVNLGKLECLLPCLVYRND